MDNFITLTSDASLELFPSNRIGSFRSKLPHPIFVDRTKCEIGLYSVSFPNKLPTIVDGRFKIRGVVRGTGPSMIFRPAGEGEEAGGGVIREIFSSARPSIETRECSIPAGYYQSPQDLILKLNQAIFATRFREPSHQGCDLGSGVVKFEYDETTEKVSLVASDGISCEVRLQLSTDLYIKLGFGLAATNRSKFVRVPSVAPHPVDLEVGYNQIFIYSDIVEKNRIVGGQITDLLAAVPLLGEHNSTGHYAPKIIEYRAMRFDKIEEINIDLVGDDGNVLRFLSGKVILTLHIRERF